MSCLSQSVNSTDPSYRATINPQQSDDDPHAHIRCASSKVTGWGGGGGGGGGGGASLSSARCSQRPKSQQALCFTLISSFLTRISCHTITNITLSDWSRLI
ncbi:unnamed protein product [Dicrocoelium dendriticum]|nr:unnamed protein product [Dicrocoelium dendriticum]